MVIRRTDRQTDRQTDRNENITPSAEVINMWGVSHREGTNRTAESGEWGSWGGRGCNTNSTL